MENLGSTIISYVENEKLNNEFEKEQLKLQNKYENELINHSSIVTTEIAEKIYTAFHDIEIHEERSKMVRTEIERDSTEIMKYLLSFKGKTISEYFKEYDRTYSFWIDNGKVCHNKL